MRVTLINLIGAIAAGGLASLAILPLINIATAIPTRILFRIAPVISHSHVNYQRHFQPLQQTHSRRSAVLAIVGHQASARVDSRAARPPRFDRHELHIRRPWPLR